MNFFQRQDQSRRHSRRLVLLFGLAVLLIVLAVDMLVLIGVGPDPGLLIGVAVVTLAVIGISSLVRISQLRSGGAAVAQQMGAVPVPEDSTDFHLRRLRNVVEEIAIASGVPVPEIWLLDGETGINAFAAGYAPSDAAVTVTRGALEKLNREELQGVIAHEYSHILNGDMRLNIRLIGWLFGILVLAILGRKLITGMRSSDSKDALPLLAIGLALMVLGYVGVLFGRLIKAGVSRQREYLADASAVQFTRQTSGIAGALKKIGGIAEGSRLQASDGEEVSHMLFGDGVGYSSLFATHPPLLERIQALEPAFKADALDDLRQRFAAEPPSGRAEDRAMGFSSDVTRAIQQEQTSLQINAQAVAAMVADPGLDDVQRAGGLLAAVPATLRHAAESRALAMSIILALLLDQDTALRDRQLGLIEAEFGTSEREACISLQAQLIDLHPMQVLPLAALAFPRLRREPKPRLLQFIALIDRVVKADGEVGPLEYCLSKLLQVQVWEALDPARRTPRGSLRLSALEKPAEDVLAVLACLGHADAGDAQRAFAAAWEHLFPGQARRYDKPTDWRQALDRALPMLDRMQPMPKQLLIEAMTVAISQDGRVSVIEAELLRTVCGCLHCPLPPMLET